jgi:four helix bundle protein
MRDFRGLEVWQAAHQITLALYKITSQFPREELYGLTSQIRRCSASVAANIAEGCGRRGEGEFHRFLQIASGSASELDYHLILAHDLGFLKKADYARLTPDLATLRRRLSALISTVDDQRRGATTKG